MSIDFTTKVTLYRDYQNMINPVSGLARVVTDPEKFLIAKRIEGDLVEATVIDIARKGIPIALAAYHPKGVIQHPLFYFKASGEDADVPRMILMENPPDKRDPVFVIEGFLNNGKSREEICKKLEGYGLIQFLLANIAVYPQFTDKHPHEYAEHEDIVHLPDTERAEIQRYRQEGTKLGCRTDKPSLFSVAHIYPETFSNLQPKGDL